jgi:hypothetical protein
MELNKLELVEKIITTERINRILEAEIEKFKEALAYIKWSIKSCRAGDGDTRSWEQCCIDCETVAETALEGGE